MDELNLADVNLRVQQHSGTISALTLIVNVLIQTHPEKDRVKTILQQAAEGDLPVLIAMYAAGNPAIDQAFRDMLEHAIKSGRPAE